MAAQARTKAAAGAPSRPASIGAPVSKKRPLPPHEEEEDEEEEEDRDESEGDEEGSDGFVVEDEGDLRARGGGISGLIAQLFPTGRHQHLPEVRRLAAMPASVAHASFADLEAEERRALRLARKEDRIEEERERAHRLAKLQRKKQRAAAANK